MIVFSEPLPYASLANYSPRGQSPLSEKSRSLRDLVKAGRIEVIRINTGTQEEPQSVSLSQFLRTEKAHILRPFLNEETTLVPIPRSAPLPEEGALWPSKVIADFLLKEGWGKEVYPCIRRITAVDKSSSRYSADTRLSVLEHYQSLGIHPELLIPKEITLIDDILTQGRTAYACAQKLHDAFPEAVIRLFVMVRTQGLIPDVEQIIDPCTGEITYNTSTGKTTRTP